MQLARQTHDYTRHGTTSLFAALEVASGKVHARSFRRHRHLEFIAFLNPSAHPSWLNLVERWFALITEQAIRRGSFDSVRRLEAAITRWLEKWNDNARPFHWTKSATDIKRSIRHAALIYETRH